jgi:hypothetical protein
MVRIEDIAWALSNLCRYTGHCSPFYSVAQHSIMVASLVPSELALAALLHDAAEAYLGDWSSPLKALLRKNAVAAAHIREVEEGIDSAISRRFGVVLHDPRVKWADRVAYATEKRDLMPEDPILDEVFGERPEALDQRVGYWPPRFVRQSFLQAFHDFGGR